MTAMGAPRTSSLKNYFETQAAAGGSSSSRPSPFEESLPLDSGFDSSLADASGLRGLAPACASGGSASMAFAHCTLPALRHPGSAGQRARLHGTGHPSPKTRAPTAQQIPRANNAGRAATLLRARGKEWTRRPEFRRRGHCARMETAFGGGFILPIADPTLHLLDRECCSILRC